MKYTCTLLCVLCLLCVAAGCKKSVEVAAIPVGTLESYDGCKGSQSNTDVQSAGALTSSSEDCIDYNYDGIGTLMLDHINAGFNCYPGEITAVITIAGNRITITESERDSAADCLCLFDAAYKVENLSPGTYTIEVVGLYVPGGDDALEFSVNLSGVVSGTYCVGRTDYPWGAR